MRPLTRPRLQQPRVVVGHGLEWKTSPGGWGTKNGLSPPRRCRCLGTGPCMKLTMLFSTPHELTAQLKTLSSSSLQTMQQALQQLADPNSDLDRLVAIIRVERSLAAKVVNLANSAAYGGEPCDTIEAAVQRLGYRIVQDAILALMSVETFAKPLRLYGCRPHLLWRHALLTACAMRELARLNDEDTQRAYALGLLHNIGMVAIDQWVLKQEPTTTFEYLAWPEEWRPAETRMLGFDQAAATAAMLQVLGFSPIMVDAAKYQFHPDGARVGHQLAALLHVARWVRQQAGALPKPLELPDREILQMLGLKTADLLSITEKVVTEVDALWISLGLRQLQAA